MKNYRKFLAIVAFTFLVLGNAPSYAETPEPKDIFKNSEFLEEWNPKNQTFYIEMSVGMAVLIVAQNDTTQAECLSDWYEGNQKAAMDYILETMDRFPEYHPRGTILAALEKKCGKFIY